MIVRAALLVALVVVAVACSRSAERLGAPLFEERFSRPDGLVTNAWAHWHDDDPDAVRDEAWEVTSGSLFVDGTEAWTGAPDGGRPDARSSTATGSAVFRMRTDATTFSDVRVDASIEPVRFVTTERTPRQAWDGVHLWLRYQSPQHLYAISVLRRDGTVAIKKKCEGGTANGGTYHTLASTRFGLALGRTTEVAATARDRAGGVELRMTIDGDLVLDAVDDGVGCDAIVDPGAVGIRSDNVELRLDDLVVRPVESA